MLRYPALLVGVAVAALTCTTVTVTEAAFAPPPAFSPVPVVATTAAEAGVGFDDPVPPGTPSPEAAWELLEQLPRAELDPDLPPYVRGEFGSPWSDTDRNGCNNRQDALALWLKAAIAHGACSVHGSISDPYTGRELAVPGEIDLDHVVPLKEAWRSGASRWSPELRVAFATDLRHLIPTSATANRSKADKPPHRWMPPARTYWCEYAAVYIGAKAHTDYRLSVTDAEAEVLATALGTCAARTISLPSR